LVLRCRRPYLSTFAGAGPGSNRSRPAAPAGQCPQRRGNTPAVNVSASGECLFNDQSVEARLNGSRAVILSTNLAIVNANRVRGGEISIDVTERIGAVLGNITSGVINIPEA